MKKYFYNILILILFTDCSKVMVQYDTNSISVPEHFKNEILKKYNAEKGNNSLIYFTNNFYNDSIIVSNVKEQIFRGDVTTIESIGLAHVLKIDNDLKTKIFDNKNNCLIIIPTNKYKFIYINKIKNKKKI